MGHRPPSPWPGKTWRKPLQVPPVPWLPTLRGPSSSSSSSRFPPQPCLDFPAANQLCHPKAGSESWKAGLVQPSSGSWPGDSPRPPKTLLPAFGMQETPQNEGEIQRHRAQGLYFSHGDLGKAEDGTPGMQQHFFEGAHVRGSSMRHSLVGWLLVLKPLGGGIWMPSTDLGAQAIGACAHQPGKSRGDQ